MAELKRNILTDSRVNASSVLGKESDAKGYQDFFPRLLIHNCPESSASAETQSARQKIEDAILLRRKYIIHTGYDPIGENLGKSKVKPASFVLEHGIFRLKDSSDHFCDDLIDSAEFLRDYNKVLQTINDGPVKTLSYERMKILELKFLIHKNLNSTLELDATTEDVRDFHNVFKVDTHVHLAAAMTASQLLAFIQRKLVEEKDTIVNIKKDKDGTVTLQENLEQMFQRLKVDPTRLTTDSLDVHGDNTFQRFDNFNNKYNPFGFAELRDVFLKSSNAIKGRYFAEITSDLLHDRPPCIATEFRISIYGRSPSEWDELADWVMNYRLVTKTNRWMIQIPRIFNVWNRHAGVASFEALMSNIFLPLFEVSLDPSSHPSLHAFLAEVSGFDSVDDESKPEPSTDTWPQPDAWCHPENPPYAYYMYYMWANLASLNRLRSSRGLSTLNCRPHCGESGAIEHLASAFLTATHINHGINLQHSMPLQYLYYLAQIGLAVSPLSNNSLFLDYRKNPFNVFFHRGLLVSLSTDDPLQFHYTQSPLIEEYAVASQHWKFNSIDLSELARNSVLISGFSHATKSKWLGPTYFQEGTTGNDIAFTNVPNIRVAFRTETLTAERLFISPLPASPSVPHAPASHDLSPSSPSSSRELSLSFSHISDLRGWNALEISHPADVPVNITAEGVKAIYNIQEAKLLRRKYVLHNAPFHPEEQPLVRADIATLAYQCIDGVFSVSRESLQKLRVLPYAISCHSNAYIHRDAIFSGLNASDEGAAGDDTTLKERFQAYQTVVPFAEFYADYQRICQIADDGPTRSWTFKRLKLLDFHYRFHLLMNKSLEKSQVKRINSDFYQTHKVDTHVHLSSAPHPEQLLVFMKNTLEQNGDDIVSAPDQRPETLADVFKRLHLSVDQLTVDSLGMSNLDDAFSRFDTFKEKYNPFGSPQMRNIFLQRENHNQGRYYGSLISNVMDISSNSPQYHTEYRITINGRYASEWDQLAAWVDTNNLIRPSQNCWVVQIPRNYHALREAGHVTSFQQMLSNIFEPLFAITLRPDANPQLVAFLSNVSGFDSVDDESVADVIPGDHVPPSEWTSSANPPYIYYMYYMWANITALNNIRRALGLSIFDFRPHSGAAGDWRHLSATFLVSNGISHGLRLDDRTVLQYLFYLNRIPIYCSPIAENGLYVTLDDHPFIKFFRRGLSVSLCTDNPLQHHFTEEPLIEEYAIAAQLHALSPIDMTEIALNSVHHSGFPDKLKESWLGKNFHTGNDPHKTNLPPIRHSFRALTFRNEKTFLNSCMRCYTETGCLRRDIPQLNQVLDVFMSHLPPDSPFRSLGSSFSTPPRPDPSDDQARQDAKSKNIQAYFKGIAHRVARAKLHGSTIGRSLLSSQSSDSN